MDAILFPDVVPEDRARLLSGEADEVLSEFEYSRPLTADELAALYEENGENSAEIDRITEAMNEAVQGFREQLKPLQANAKVYAKEIRTKTKFQRGTVYKITDMVTKMVGFYDAEGRLISSRPARAGELQLTFQSERRLRKAE